MQYIYFKTRALTLSLDVQYNSHVTIEIFMFQSFNNF